MNYRSFDVGTVHLDNAVLYCREPLRSTRKTIGQSSAMTVKQAVR